MYSSCLVIFGLFALAKSTNNKTMLDSRDVSVFVPTKCRQMKELKSDFISPRELDEVLKNIRSDELMNSFHRGLGITDKGGGMKTIAVYWMKWMQFGFAPYGNFSQKNLQVQFTIILAWLMPAHLKHGRSHLGIWNLGASLATVLGMFDLVHFNHKRHQLRVMLRAFGTGVQCSTINKLWNHSHWSAFCAYLFNTFWHPERFPKKIESGCYFMWAQQHKGWYIGKADIERTKGGMQSRFKEHMLSTYKPDELNGRERRYTSWRNMNKEHMCFVPFVWGKEQSILLYERQVINTLQAPMQDRTKGGSYHVSKFRLWKRLRQKPSIDKEIQLNMCNYLVDCEHKQEKEFGVPSKVRNFDDLVIWLNHVEGLSRKRIEKQLYDCRRVFWLALYLATPHAKLDYGRVWKAGAMRLMMGVWCASRYLDRQPAMAVQKRVDRFLDISKLVRVRQFTIRIPAMTLGAATIVKRHLSELIARVRYDFDWLAKYLMEKIHVVRTKARSLAHVFGSHIQHARNFNRQSVSNWQREDIKRWRVREDTVCSKIQWDVQVENRNADVCTAVGSQFFRVLADFGVMHYGRDILHDVRNSVYVQVSDAQKSLVHMAKQISNGQLAVVADKDSKRRIFMSHSGYHFRLADGYLSDNPYYKRVPCVSKTQLAQYKNYLVSKHLPKGVLRFGRFDEGNLPYCYHNYKEKCLNACGGLSCKKDHSHEREIVSEALSPIKGHLRLTARAIRLTKKVSKEFTWTFWNQSEIGRILDVRFQQLEFDARFTHICPCGKSKNLISQIKLDAAQFFKQADICRGVRRIRELLNRVTRQTGLKAIAVSRSQRVSGHLCKASRKSDRAVKVVHFNHINKVLDYILEDRFFTLGDTIMCRQTGWPQGGPLSEPGTLVDLGEDVRHLQAHKDEMSNVGWKIPGKDLELRQVICGLCHVDDALLISKVLCCDCIEAGVSKMWPADVGTSKEEEGNVVRFLHTVVSVESGRPRIIPYVPNLLFTLGITNTQKIARIGHFAGAPMNNYHQIRIYVFCQVLSANHLCNGRVHDLYFVIWSLISEIIQLGWPQSMVAKALRSIPRRHVSKLVIACRLLGRFMKHSSWSDLPHPCSVGFELDPMCCVLFKFCLDNHSHSLPDGIVDLSSWWKHTSSSTGCKEQNTIDMAGKGWQDKGKGKGWKGPGKWSNQTSPPRHEQQWGQQGYDPPPLTSFGNNSAQMGNDLMRVMADEYQKQLDEKQLEKQKDMVAEGVSRAFGFRQSTTAQPSSGSQDANDSKPFQFVKQLTKKMFNWNDGPSDANQLTDKSDKKSKKKKKGKKRKRSSSSSSSDDSSESTPSWVKDAREQSSSRKSKKKKDKKEKDKKSSKDRLRGFRIPSTPGAPETVEDEGKLDQIKEALIKGALIQDKCTMDDLKVDEWMKVVCTNARQEDLKNLCEVNSLGKQGSKEALVSRIVNHLKGGDEE